jgi:hypothetical protein
MKYISILFLACFLLITVSPVMADTPTKEVCKEVKKNGKTKQVCKKIKVHKKLSGTKVPEKKK